MSSRDDVELSDFVRLAMEARLATVHVGMPCEVHSFDPDANTVDVVPKMDRATKTADGSILAESLPVLPSVPIVWPRSGLWALTFPLAVGDGVWVTCADRSIGEWRRNGSSDPKQIGTHRLDGATAFPGVEPIARAIASARIPANGVRLGWVGAGDGPSIELSTDGVIVTHPTSGIALRMSSAFDRVQVDSGGTAEFVAQGVLVEGELSELKAAIQTAQAAITPNDGGAAFVTALLAALVSWPGNTKAAKLKAE